MNQFMQSTKRMLSIHGNPITYKSVVNGTYNVETGSIGKTENVYNVQAYKKQIKANQFNFPHLINQDIAEFLICSDGFNAVPAPKDFIVDSSSSKYIVESIKEYRTNGEIVMYSLVARKA